MIAKKILIAADASVNARRAAAHVGAIIGGQSGFSVTILSLERPPERDLYDSDEAHQNACREREQTAKAALDDLRRILLEAGVPEASVEARFIVSCRSPLAAEVEKCSLGQSIALEILEIAKNEDFGVVAVGRRGVSKAEEFLFGSVSAKIVHNAKGLAVWVVA